MDLDYLKASDGTGKAVLAHIQTDRSIGATVIDVDTVDNWPQKFIVTTGTLNASGFIIESTMCEMRAHLNAGDIVIDSFEPGYTDVGNEDGQIAVVKQTTGWADSVATQLKTVTEAVVPAGTLAPFAARTAPTNWLLAQGQAVSRATYANLFNAIVPLTGTATITIAAPAVVTLNAHGFNLGDPIYFTSTGALPTGLNVNTIYYVVPVNANTFNLSTTLTNAIAGTKITTTGTQSGVHSVRHCPYGLGDGTTTFNLPDGRSREFVGAGAGQSTTTFANTDVTVATDIITVPTTNWLYTGQKVRLTTTGTLPTGLALATDYYVIRISATQIKLATTLNNAVNRGGTAIDITAQGTGVNTITQLLTPRNLGDLGGEETHGLTDADMPETAIRARGSLNDFANYGSGGATGGWSATSLGANNGTGRLGVDGGSQAHNIMNPFFTGSWIIKT